MMTRVYPAWTAQQIASRHALKHTNEIGDEEKDVLFVGLVRGEVDSMLGVKDLNGVPA